MTRVGYLSIAVAFALALAACGGDDDVVATNAGARATTAPATTGSATTALSPVTPSPQAPPPTTTVTTGAAPTTATTAQPAPTTTEAGPIRIVVNVVNGESDAESRISVERGEEVEIVVMADTSDEVHVHGYDYKAEVTPTEPGIVTFVADLPGIYEVEFEDSRLVLFELEVR